MKFADLHALRRFSARTRSRFGVAALASGALAASAALAVSGCSAAPQTAALAGNNSPEMQMAGALAGSYQVLTLNNKRDITFNQLLGINNDGIIVGYFGSGAAGHPNKGYVLLPPFAQRDFFNENFPGSAQTQVIGINDHEATVGFWVNKAGANFGFYSVNGRLITADFPTGTPAKPPVDQLLGVNNHNVAVGFFTNSGGQNRGYTYNINTKKFARVLVPGAAGLGPSLTAAGINNAGAITGFYNKTATVVDAFLKTANGHFTTIAFPGASSTEAFGVNDSGEVVGQYTVGTGNAAVTHGFTWRAGQFVSVDIAGASATTINGVNNEGDLVGFYTDAKGNTDGFFALP
jgi:hypothetical protein